MVLGIGTMLVWFGLMSGLNSTTNGLEAYDCEHKDTKHLALDLLEPPDCNNPESYFLEPSKELVQLVRFHRSTAVTGASCRIIMNKDVTGCHMWSHTSGTFRTVWDQVARVKRDLCSKWLREHRITDYAGLDVEITPGVPFKYRYFSKGKLHNDGTCEVETQFESGGVVKHYSYEETILEITVKSVRGFYDPETGYVIFNNGLKAKYSSGYVHDAYLGTMEWEIEDEETDRECVKRLSKTFEGYVRLYKKKHSSSRVGSVAITHPDDNDSSLGMALAKPRRVCGAYCYAAAAHPKYSLCFYDGSRPQLPLARFLASAPKEEITLQMLENNRIRSDHQQLSSDIIVQTQIANITRTVCENGRRTLFNKLQAISGSKNPHALVDLYGPGFLITPAGSAVAYVSKCVPVNVTLASFDNCTEQIPVRMLPSPGEEPVEDESQLPLRFLEPVTLVLRTYPSVVTCSNVMPVRWKIGDHWYCSTPSVTQCDSPVQLDPNLLSQVKFDATFVRNAANEGLLTAEERESLHLLLHRNEARSALESSLSGRSVTHSGGGELGPIIGPIGKEDLTHHVLGHIYPFGFVERLGTGIVQFVSITAVLAMIWGCCACSGRFFNEFRTWGCDGGRTCGRALFAAMGLVTWPLHMIASVARANGWDWSQEGRPRPSGGFGRMFRQNTRPMREAWRQSRAAAPRGPGLGKWLRQQFNHRAEDGIRVYPNPLSLPPADAPQVTIESETLQRNSSPDSGVAATLSRENPISAPEAFDRQAGHRASRVSHNSWRNPHQRVSVTLSELRQQAPHMFGGMSNQDALTLLESALSSEGRTSGTGPSGASGGSGTTPKDPTSSKE